MSIMPHVRNTLLALAAIGLAPSTLAYGPPSGYHGQPPYGHAQPGYGHPPAGYGYAPRGYAQPMPTAPVAPTTQPSTSVENTGIVSIEGMRFQPATLVVDKGDTVTWTHNSPMPHSVKANDGDFGSSVMSSGQSFSQTFDEPGTYSYYCSLHPSMRGKIVVK